MAKYRALGPIYLRKLVKAGEEFESELPPSRNWHPLDDEAREAVGVMMATRGKVLAISDRLDPAPPKNDSVEIPQDWQTMSGPKRRALAQKLGAQSNVKEADANTYIESELERRGQKAA